MKYRVFILLILCLQVTIRLTGQDREEGRAALGQLLINKEFTSTVSKGRELLAGDSLDPQVHYCLGLAYSNLRQYRQACMHLEKANQLQPGNRSLILNLAEAYCEVADLAAAEVLVKDLVKSDTTDLFSWIELAQILQRESRTDEAAAVYLRLWRSDSSNIWYPRQIGMLLARNERYKEAVPFLEFVVQGDSTDQTSFLRLGQAYVILKDTSKIPVLDKAIRQDSMQPQLHRYRGGLFMGAGKYRQAEEDLKKALELGDTTVFTCRHLGITQYQLSKYAEALWALDRTVKIDSLNTEAWYYLGFSYKWTGDIPKGIECLNRALRIAVPVSVANIYSGLGLFYQLRNEYNPAMTFYQKAVEYNPADPVPYAQLGVLVELTAGRKELAKGYYERFLREYAGSDQSLVKYAEYRLQMINEKLFMEGKLKK